MVSSKAFNPKQTPAETTLEIYKGIYAPDTVRRSVITALYQGLCGAQQMTDEEPEGKKLKGGESVHQLNLEENRPEEPLS
jgi:hypothetical protein